MSREMWAGLALLGLASAVGCRDPVALPLASSDGGGDGEGASGALGRGNGGEMRFGGEGGHPGAAGEIDGASAASAGAASAPVGSSRPAVVTCGRQAPPACRVSGDSSRGVRLLGTLLEPNATRVGGVLDLDTDGNVRCADCDCGEAGEALVIDCPGLVIAPGFINLHEHLSYAGTPPLSHPGELYEHRSDWRLGENGHAALPFAGGATTAQVLAQELRHLMAGTTSVVGAGGRHGFVRNLEVPGQTEGILPGPIRAETFPLDDTHGSVDGSSCSFGPQPDTAATAAAVSAYVPHVGEGTDQRAQDELSCALGSLDLIGENSAVIHAMALTRDAAHELQRRGASVVWSPRSNIDLYGSTAPVALLSSLGVRVALGTDWLASGSMNLLRELACARSYDDQVLGGYFDAYELLRMVTENPAWALRLEQRLGGLKRGLVGDIAVFAETSPDPYASVVEAEPGAVKLVLRQGQPLYGDSQLVKAFRDGEACEELEVCGAQQRVCAVETGSSLAEIQAAGEAVYPLFSCAPRSDEPSCIAQVARECPAGEQECEPPAASPAWNTTDADADGVPDAVDVCPRVADEQQLDSDHDGRGDACDPCPLANLALEPCPRRIAELRRPMSRFALHAAARLTGVRVTAVRLQGSKGFYLEDGDHGPYSGIFVYTGGAAPGVKPGDVVTVQGYFDSFQGTDELVNAEVLLKAPAVEPYGPLLVALADVADGSAEADALASLWLRIEGAEVELQNPDLPKDYDETLLLGGLRLDDLIFADLDNQYPIGTRFSSLQGIAGFSFGHHKLYPLASSDVALE
jgi:cytosine/adenosine deaminase-related metal-dependent hydrolase